MGRGSRPIRALAERPHAQEEGTREAAGGGGGRGAREDEAGRDVSLVTAIHLYVTDLDRSIDWYTRLLGRGPAAAYDEGENAHSAFFVLEGQTFLVLTWDPERGREIGGSARLELAGDDIQAEIDAARPAGDPGGRVTRTRFGTEVYDLADPDGHLVRIGAGVDAPRHRRRRLGRRRSGLTTTTSPGGEPDPLALAGGELDHGLRALAAGEPPRAQVLGDPEHAALPVEEDRVDGEAHEPHVNGRSGAKEDSFAPLEPGTSEEPSEPGRAVSPRGDTAHKPGCRRVVPALTST